MEKELVPQHTHEISDANRELLLKYVRLLAYAKDQKSFTRVYRAEGDKSKPHLSHANPTLAGTWFTPTFSNAEAIKNSETRSGPDMKIVSIVIPQSILEERDSTDQGMNQINVLSPDLLEGVVVTECEITTEPNIDDYLKQFSFINELRQKGLI
jgi:hypothetical protein